METADEIPYWKKRQLADRQANESAEYIACKLGQLAAEVIIRLESIKAYKKTHWIIRSNGFWNGNGLFLPDIEDAMLYTSVKAASRAVDFIRSFPQWKDRQVSVYEVLV